MVNLTNVKIWHDALMSGQYPQTNGTLVRNGEYCCLGVATHEAIKHGLTGLRLVDTKDNHGFRRIAVDYLETDVLPPEVRDWLGVTHADPELLHDNSSVSASSLNDELLLSFQEIALCIRHTWPEAFALVGSDEVTT